jgi:hypothetical protein
MQYKTKYPDELHRGIYVFAYYALLEKTYAVALVNTIVKRPSPVTPDGTVSRPKPAPAPAVAAAEMIPLTATATVTVFAPAVLSINRSNFIPALAPSCAPSSVPVGSVIVVAAADVDVM